jgi:uncharacterized protein DUF4159
LNGRPLRADPRSALEGRAILPSLQDVEQKRREARLSIPRSTSHGGPMRAGLLLTTLLVPSLLFPQQDAPRWFRGQRYSGPEVEAPGLRSPHGFYFTRAVYSGRYRSRWATDYPKADRQLMIGVRRILRYVDAFADENPVRLDDPRLARFPFLYAAEVGSLGLTEGEVSGLRHYLLAGGFLMVDDFWGSDEWENFEVEIKRVLPENPIVEMPLDHPLFHSFYDIDEIIQVPNVAQGIRGGPTWEQDGFVPHCRGIFDKTGRLMVLINWNTDLGDAWEWAEQGEYPRKYTDFAYQMAVNTIVYATSH